MCIHIEKRQWSKEKSIFCCKFCYRSNIKVNSQVLLPTKSETVLLMFTIIKRYIQFNSKQFSFPFANDFVFTIAIALCERRLTLRAGELDPGCVVHCGRVAPTASSQTVAFTRRITRGVRGRPKPSVRVAAETYVTTELERNGYNCLNV